MAFCITFPRENRNFTYYGNTDFVSLATFLFRWHSRHTYPSQSTKKKKKKTLLSPATAYYIARSTYVMVQTCLHVHVENARDVIEILTFFKQKSFISMNSKKKVSEKWFHEFHWFHVSAHCILILSKKSSLLLFLFCSTKTTTKKDSCSLCPNIPIP